MIGSILEKGMWFQCEQPFLSGEHCVTSPKMAVKETDEVTEKITNYSLQSLNVIQCVNKKIEYLLVY